MPIANPVCVVPITADTTIPASFYAGHNFFNTRNQAATVTIYDGTSAAGCVLDRIAVPGNGSCSVLYPITIPLATGSLFVDWSTGVEGSVRVIT